MAPSWFHGPLLPPCWTLWKLMCCLVSLTFFRAADWGFEGLNMTQCTSCFTSFTSSVLSEEPICAFRIWSSKWASAPVLSVRTLSFCVPFFAKTESSHPLAALLLQALSELPSLFVGLGTLLFQLLPENIWSWNQGFYVCTVDVHPIHLYESFIPTFERCFVSIFHFTYSWQTLNQNYSNSKVILTALHFNMRGTNGVQSEIIASIFSHVENCQLLVQLFHVSLKRRMRLLCGLNVHKPGRCWLLIWNGKLGLVPSPKMFQGTIFCVHPPTRSHHEVLLHRHLGFFFSQSCCHKFRRGAQVSRLAGRLVNLMAKHGRSNANLKSHNALAKELIEDADVAACHLQEAFQEFFVLWTKKKKKKTLPAWEVPCNHQKSTWKCYPVTSAPESALTYRDLSGKTSEHFRTSSRCSLAILHIINSSSCQCNALWAEMKPAKEVCAVAKNSRRFGWFSSFQLFAICYNYLQLMLSFRDTPKKTKRGAPTSQTRASGVSEKLHRFGKARHL